ncbi:MAG: hypothetical protein QTO32_00270 [Candidatus Organicella extenuata]|uniref:Uncharacterized protein n=1 Tax=Candidatus Organicella extenuata TaxID=2841811 RepID=A0AA51BKP5_9BACT|nr:MAG: hypothetical protein QTO32_00270 [Candidatus Organicella extenuata]
MPYCFLITNLIKGFFKTLQVTFLLLNYSFQKGLEFALTLILKNADLPLLKIYSVSNIIKRLGSLKYV